jgi:hypothetical protein
MERRRRACDRRDATLRRGSGQALGVRRFGKLSRRRVRHAGPSGRAIWQSSNQALREPQDRQAPAAETSVGGGVGRSKGKLSAFSNELSAGKLSVFSNQLSGRILADG